MYTVGGHWEITRCVGRFFKLSPLESNKSYGASSRRFDIYSATWSTVSPILGYCVARTGPAASVYATIDYHQDFFS
jgi:hypothetical protein